LDVDPNSGEGFVVGDAVNTAARLQAQALPMEVVVGPTTHDLAASSFVFERLPRTRLKGKSSLIRPWKVVRTIARTGVDTAQRFSTPLVGRSTELALLQRLFDKSLAGHAQFLLVSGEAGVGKSRLVFELASWVDARADVLVTWRQGRCLPYEDSAALWALAEIVQAHLGVLESDATKTIEAKLDGVFPDHPDGEWVRSRLRPFVGLPAPAASRDENFAAWGRFVELVAETRPTVLVFDDVHWAGEATLAFLDHLATTISGLPLFVIAVGRSEVLQRQRDLGAWLSEPDGAAGSVAHLELRALDGRSAARLVSQLSGGLDHAVQDAISHRCGGNPFFAEELVRLVADGSSGRDGTPDAMEEAQKALPTSLQALVGARLDALEVHLRQILTDAAVVGQNFWPGAVSASGGGGSADLVEGLGDLGSREFVRAVPTSVIEGEREFSFWHAITREVAYSRLPRSARAHKHAAVARWIENLEYKPIVAEVLAHHYAQAVELAEATGEDSLAEQILEPAVAALQVAGDYVLPLDVSTAERYYARAVALLPGQAAGRPKLLMAWGQALAQDGRLREGAQAVQDAIELALRAGERPTAAIGMVRLDWILALLNDTETRDLAEQAEELMQGEPPSPELVTVMGHSVVNAVRRLDADRALVAADRAIELCRELGLPNPAAAIGYRGMAKGLLGDEGGLDDLEAGIKTAIAEGLGQDAGALYCNLADMISVYRGPEAASRKRREGIEFAERRGDNASISYLKEGLFSDLVWGGRWDEAVGSADELQRLLGEHADLMDLSRCWANMALLLSLRGRGREAQAFAVKAEGEGLRSWALHVRCACLVSLSAASAALDPGPTALEPLLQCEHLPMRLRRDPDYAYRLPEACRLAVAAGMPDLAERLAQGLPMNRAWDRTAVTFVEALLHEAAGELGTAIVGFEQASRGWRALGVPYEEAQACLGAGRALLALGRGPEATRVVARARELLARLGAEPALAEADGLVASKSPASTNALRESSPPD
jgi:hypothetical protein